MPDAKIVLFWWCLNLSLSLSICVYIYSYHSLYIYTLTSSSYISHIMKYVSVLLPFLTPPLNNMNTFIDEGCFSVCSCWASDIQSVSVCQANTPDQQTMAWNVLWVTDGLFGHFRLPWISSIQLSSHETVSCTHSLKRPKESNQYSWWSFITKNLFVSSVAHSGTKLFYLDCEKKKPLFRDFFWWNLRGLNPSICKSVSQSAQAKICLLCGFYTPVLGIVSLQLEFICSIYITEGCYWQLQKTELIESGGKDQMLRFIRFVTEMCYCIHI